MEECKHLRVEHHPDYSGNNGRLYECLSCGKFFTYWEAERLGLLKNVVED
jgi:hypothetical protein